MHYVELGAFILYLARLASDWKMLLVLKFAYYSAQG